MRQPTDSSAWRHHPASGGFPFGPWDVDGAVDRKWPGPPRLLRLWIPVILSLLVQVVPMLLPLRLNLAHVLVGQPIAALLGVAVMAIGPFALLAAHRFPGPVIALVTAAAASAMLFGGQNWPPYISLGFAIVFAIVHDARLWAWISVGVGWLTTLMVALAMGESWHPLRIAGITLGILVVFGIGEGIRGRRDHLNEFRRLALEHRVGVAQAERVRLARELHDVLAHSLSQINVQAGVGLHLMEAQPEKAAEALSSIKLTSKTALDEVRSVLGILRSEDNPDAPLVPEPDLSRLAGLAASVTDQGVAVTLNNRIGSPPAAVQLALYRISQESLTNVVRHAHASEATVSLVVDAGDYVLTVTDNGTGTDSAGGSGRGLLGMRERAELLGGHLRAGRRPAGGFEIEARIPMRESS